MKRPPKILLNIAGRPWTHAPAQEALALSSPHSYMRLVTVIVFAVFICEVLVMVILSYLPAFPTRFQALFDATLLVFLLSPVLYFGLFRTLVQFIAATNFDLDRLMAKNPFRNNLCYRLKGGWLHLPPLREREDTVKALDQIQKRHILSVYEQMGHNKSRTARSLGIDLNTLRRKLESYGVK